MAFRILTIFLVLWALVASFWVIRKVRHRRRLMAAPFPKEWAEILRRDSHLYRAVPETLKPRWHDLIRVFRDEVALEGCGGFAVTDEIRLAIAAQATLVLLGRDQESFRNVDVVLVYPDAFVAEERVELDGAGHAVVGPTVRDGEAWGGQGMVILSAKDVRRETRDPSSGRNVVLHEFSHQLDWAEGAWKDASVSLRESRSRFSETLAREYERLCDEVDRDVPGVLDDYGAENPAEFFAVATEAFFTWPGDLAGNCPDLYRELKGYYGLDPREWEPSRPA